eukprot:6016555-Karenia_brevis.AAC.1
MAVVKFDDEDDDVGHEHDVTDGDGNADCVGNAGGDGSNNDTDTADYGGDGGDHGGDYMMEYDGDEDGG